jgi:hypothetical protein
MLVAGAWLVPAGAGAQPADDAAPAPAEAEAPPEAAEAQAEDEAEDEAEVRRVESPYVGLSVTPTNPETRAQLKLGDGVGLTVMDVAAQSPAADAGLQRLDVIHRLNDQLLVNQQQLSTLIRLHGSGQEVTLHLFRAGEARDVKVTIGKTQRLVRPHGWRQQIRFAPGGVEVVPLEPRRGDRPRWAANDPDADARRQHIERQMDRLRRELKENEALQDAQRQEIERKLLLMHRQMNAVRGDAPAGGNVTHAMRINDGEHDIEIRTTDDDKHLKVTDAAGEIVFEGPINTDEQRAKVPAEVMEKIEKFEKRARIEIRINRLDMADPARPPEPAEPEPHTLN